MSVQTEDTGKCFEMAICLAYGIPYDGPYKYGMAIPEKLRPRLRKLVELFPLCTHTAKRGARYDYTAVDDISKHLSAKTTKKGGGKVAPQVVGQSQPKKFCEVLNIPFTTNEALKQYIQENIKTVLPVLVDHTFDCPNIYYNEEKDTIQYIVLTKPIDWNTYEYTWTRSWEEWANSTTLKINSNKKDVSLVEFQFHTASRTNMAIRWCYENFLILFKDHLTIITL